MGPPGTVAEDLAQGGGLPFENGFVRNEDEVARFTEIALGGEGEMDEIIGRSDLARVEAVLLKKLTIVRAKRIDAVPEESH